MPENESAHGDILHYEARWDYEEQVPKSSIDDETDNEGEGDSGQG